ncbi:MAG TPA: glycosyltransferase [Chthonomonadaceae bacterium]|nr:glycosyltransferase [Chthonomonadaceae bacterium]
MTRQPITLWHIITGLDTGGAERMLAKLLSGLDRQRFALEVLSLTDIGPVGKGIQEQGIPVRALGMRRGVPDPAGLLRLAGWLRRGRPRIVQTWMYHADLIGGLAGMLAGQKRIAWNIRHSDLAANSKRSTIWTARACARLSRLVPARIVCCSHASQRVHAALGYAAEKMVVIPNGFDLSAYHPDPAARRAVRQELGLPEDAPLIGLIARFDPQKDHETFAQAAGLLRQRRPKAHFLLCGDGIEESNARLAGWIEAAGAGDRCLLLGRRADIPRLAAALDILTSSSAYGEGFPNVVGEAMACGVPCVVTDVGDSAQIVGETGMVVPIRAPERLAAAWEEWIAAGTEERARRGQAARCRVEAHFSLPAIVGRYTQFYEELAGLCAD